MFLNCGVGEDSWKSPLDCKEIQPVHPKWNQSWVFIGRTDVEAETPILWPVMCRADSFEKTLMLGKIEGRRRRGRQRMRWLHGITDLMDKFGWNPGVGDGQRGLACCDSWGHKESYMTEWLNWTEVLGVQSEKDCTSLLLHFLTLDVIYLYILIQSHVHIGIWINWIPMWVANLWFMWPVVPLKMRL